MHGVLESYSFLRYPVITVEAWEIPCESPR